ncbi:hypothetical protein [Ruminococcus sp. Marseille-P6503]|uniref:hypothetical protein n=1 Tax=Ruminococcus sp. Marseille-P6503 TaxID=2364796 RepID=UPI000F541E05|nr:hypothetical protein [Ruminococcus sp. Marseille-P6503]
MTKYFKEYIAYIRKCLESKNTDFSELLEYHRKHIEFFMHERLVHLIVTVLFALLTVACFIAIVCAEKVILVPLAVLLLVLLIPYIKHYYFLENQTQQLYKDYDEICRRAGKAHEDTENKSV